MVEGGRGSSFPVLFFDGEREMNIGDVKINPTLEYKPFQHMLSQKIGISPNQISIYLVDRQRNHKTPFLEDRRRIPITGKVNFGLICRPEDCCFLVVLKRSRKSRNRREGTTTVAEFADFFPESEFSPKPPQMQLIPDNLVLLRRNQPVPFHDLVSQSGISDLNDRLHNLKIQRENYQMAMGKASSNPPSFGSGHVLDTDSIPNLSVESSPGIGDRLPVTSMMMTTTNNRFFCEECEKNRGTKSFHPCVNDVVITPFTSPSGPINRPFHS